MFQTESIEVLGDKNVLIKYNSFFFSERRKIFLGNIYFTFDNLKYLYLIHFNSNKGVGLYLAQVSSLVNHGM